MQKACNFVFYQTPYFVQAWLNGKLSLESHALEPARQSDISLKEEIGLKERENRY